MSARVSLNASRQSVPSYRRYGPLRTTTVRYRPRYRSAIGLLGSCSGSTPPQHWPVLIRGFHYRPPSRSSYWLDLPIAGSISSASPLQHPLQPITALFPALPSPLWSRWQMLNHADGNSIRKGFTTNLSYARSMFAHIPVPMPASISLY